MPKSHSPSKHIDPTAVLAEPKPEQKPDRRLALRDVLKMLTKDGMLAREEAERILNDRHSYKDGTHPLVIVADLKLKSLLPPNKVMQIDALTEWLAGKVDLEYMHIDPLKIDFAAVTDVMSNAYAARFHILPVQVTPREVVVATAEPYVHEWERELMPILRKQIRCVMANPIDIERYQIEFYNLARSVKKATNSGQQTGSNLSGFEQLVELGRTNRQFDANEQHIVHIVDWLWQYAFEQRASDIHIEPRRDLGVVRFRIDGVLHQVYQTPMSVTNAMTSRIKILGRMDVIEKRRPQDGRIKTRTPEGVEIELRLSTLPTAFGEKLVMRIFDPEVLVRDFSELGFSEDDRKRWDSMVHQPNGIVLVTGPTGSGKTTTLYSTLKQLATPEVNVCTIEDPIEMVEDSFNQMQVQPQIDLTFADGVRALMRQDPDIIMIGEIRDLATAEMAIQAALTGHLVLSTLHTNDAPSAITRLLNLGVPPYLINATLLGVMAQRLVRTLCPHCKKPVDMEPDEKQTWTNMVTPFKSAMPSQIHQPIGCLECRMTGYMGRMGIYEILLVTSEIRKHVKHDTDVARIRAQAYREGMKPLRVSGAMKVARGITSLDEVSKVAPPGDEEVSN